MEFFSDPLPNTIKPKKGGPLPKTVKETLQEANTQPALTDEQLVELFKDSATLSDSNPAKKTTKKSSKKKPNKGKTPNNIRKTKKPAKM